MGRLSSEDLKSKGERALLKRDGRLVCHPCQVSRTRENAERSLDDVCARRTGSRSFKQDMSVTLWAVLGFRLALPQSLHAFTALARRRSILSSLRHPVEQKHEPRATLFSGINVVQRVQ
jgi:hypothetical protein